METMKWGIERASGKGMVDSSKQADQRDGRRRRRQGRREGGGLFQDCMSWRKEHGILPPHGDGRVSRETRLRRATGDAGRRSKRVHESRPPHTRRPQDIRRQLCGSPPRSPSPPQHGADAGDGKENGTVGDAEAEHNGPSAAEVEPPRPRLVAEFRLVRRESAAYAGRSWAYAFSPYPHTPPPLQPL